MKFSVTKTRTDSALPVVVQPDIVLLYAEDIEQMPAVNDRKILATSELLLKFKQSPYSLYLTSADQSAASNAEGDVSVRGWVQQISGTFPGTGRKIAEWMAANINMGFVALRKHCAGSYKMYGSKYNPLFLTGNFTEDPERSVCQVEFKQTRRSKVPYIHYDVSQLYPVKPGEKRVWVIGTQDGTPLIFNNNTLIEL